MSRLAPTIIYQRQHSWQLNPRLIILAWSTLLAALVALGRTSGLLITIPTAAAYGRAAERDERSGFPCTAAMEWRKAAELLSPLPLLADWCWCEWERLMQLSRRLAGPVGNPDAVSGSALAIKQEPTGLINPRRDQTRRIARRACRGR